MALPDTILLKYPDQANSQENPYIAKNWDEIKACLGERGIYAEASDSLANTIIDLNTTAADQGRINIFCKYFDGKKVTIKNLYTTASILFFFYFEDSSVNNYIMKNINFINCYQNSNSTSATFFRVNCYNAVGTFIHYITNCKFSGMNYAEETAFMYNSCSGDNTSCINKLIFNSCSFNYRSIYPISHDIFGYVRSSRQYVMEGIIYELINCNCYFDLPNGFYDRSSSSPQNTKSFICGTKGTSLINCKIKVKLGGNQYIKTSTNTIYSYYSYTYSKNSVFDFDFYTNFTPPAHWVVFDYDKTIVRESNVTAETVEAIYRPETNNEYLTTTSLIIIDKLEQYLTNNVYYYNYNAGVDKLNYYKTSPEFHLTDEQILSCSQGDQYTCDNRLSLERIFMSIYWYNGSWYPRIAWTRPKLTSYELVPCTEEQSKNKLFLLEHYFPLMWESDDDEI